MYLEQQLQSIVNQTLLPDEVIIFDDNSTDDSYKIINEYACKYSKIKWICRFNNENLGFIENFKNCLAKASGDLVFLCDQDDIWELDKLDDSVSIMQRNPQISLLVTNYSIKYEKQSKHNKQNLNNSGTIEHVLSPNALTNNYRPGCTFCIRKQLLSLYFLFWDNKYYHDYLLWRLAIVTDAAYLYNKRCIIWRRHANNASDYRGGKITFENFVKRKTRIQNDISWFKRISNTVSPSWKNVVKEYFDYLNLRLQLYTSNKVGCWIKLFKYRRFYSTFKSWILDYLLCIKYKGEEKNDFYNNSNF